MVAGTSRLESINRLETLITIFQAKIKICHSSEMARINRFESRINYYEQLLKNLKPCYLKSRQQNNCLF